MLSFILGVVIGVFWPVYKWLTYDLLKAVCKGTYRACRVVCFGELKPGFNRWGVVKHLPRFVYYAVKAYLKWEWLRGYRLV